MPSNLIVINNELEWEVPDSKMDEVIQVLDTLGEKVESEDKGE